jgi:hypothetical protein
MAIWLEALARVFLSFEVYEQLQIRGGTGAPDRYLQRSFGQLSVASVKTNVRENETLQSFEYKAAHSRM